MLHFFEKLTEVKPIIWGLIILFMLFVIVSRFISSHRSNTNSHLTTKKIVYGGMCVALSFILSYIRIYNMPQGGSITLASMFPIILYAMIFGTTPGIIAGIAYGFLQLIQEPSVVHWAQLLLDYPLAYGVLGFAGITPKFISNLKLRTTLAISIAIFGRGLMHFLSGVIFYAEWTPEGMSTFTYSLIYNASYIIPELIITVILALIVITTPIYSTLKRNAAY